MQRPLFLRIVDSLSNYDTYFTQRRNSAGKRGLSPIQKCTAAIRMLAYGVAADACDEYVKIGETTAVECVSKFCEGIVAIFENDYLRRPNEEDLQRLLKVGEERGFPGMIGSTLNDINVLERPPVFDDIEADEAPHVNFTVNGHQYDLAYYLADGIYP
ncbi:uncharacterized protein LOC109831745 [Asparagus officinalis]|uniref:uncharacterized protein LOC109831745 n=1 Tax=Asparagus officinalis TaxID=4686 RepID=UPI00098E41FB|nr:uncharacterized protein LOC109831745 [Asparagus officinalis]